MNLRMFFALSVSAVFLMLNVSESYAVSWSDYTAPTCLILDKPMDPIYQSSLAIIPSSRFEGYSKTGMLEIDGDWNNLAYFHDVLAGDMDLDMMLRSIVFLRAADIQLPNQLIALGFSAGWTWRYIDGIAFQVRVDPGIYSDLESMGGDDFYMPFSLSFFRAFQPDLAGVAGLQIRPGFDRLIMPLIGLDWELNEHLRLSARLPQSRIQVYFNKTWMAHAGFEWNNLSYTLGEYGSYRRGMITYEDYRLSVGVTYRLSDDFQVTGEAGRSFNRSVEFEDEAPGLRSNIDIERAPFLRIGIGGPF